MMTLVEREARMVAFLRDLFPGHRVVASLQDHAAARAAGLVALPEIRVRLLAAGRLLRWEVVLAQGDLASDDARRIGARGVYTMAWELRRALADSPWSAGEARLLPRSPDADLWCEELLEPCSDPAAVPQSFFAVAEATGILLDAVEADSIDLGSIQPADNPPQPGDHLAIVTTTDRQYLGQTLVTTPTLVVEHAPRRAFPAGSFVYRLTQRLVLPEAAKESAVYTPRESAPMIESLDGARRLHRLRDESFQLALALPIPPLAWRSAWEAYRAAHLDRASLLLVRADLSLAEATLLREEVSPAALELRLLARVARELAPFEEAAP